MTVADRLRSSLGTPRRRAVAAGAAVVLVVAVVGAVFAASSGESAEQPPTTTEAPTTTTTAPPTTTTTPPPRAPLTGVEGTFDGRIGRPALVVKIDNVSAGRPQSGLRQADIVIEEPVEGNLTRLAAVFQSTDADVVGPVRSVRTTDLELLPLFGRPLFASSGGNAGVVPQLHDANVVDIGNNVSGQGFYRNRSRPAPHNLFSSTPDLYGKAPEAPPPPLPLFRYRSPDEVVPPGSVPTGGVALRFGGPEVSRFTWDAGTGTWLRFQSGTPHMAAEGVQIAPQNVIVLEIGYDYSGQGGRSVPHGVVTGGGNAVVLTQGHSVPATWTRPTLGDGLTLVGPDGRPVGLTPGQTFIELVMPGAWNFL